MTKIDLRILLAILLIFFIVPSASIATTKSWSTTNFTSMVHGTDYTWKVAGTTTPLWYIPAGEHITSAYLDIADLNNWAIEDDYMNIYLLNNSYSGWPTKLLLTTYEDENHYSYVDSWGRTRWVNPSEDFHYDLTGDQIDKLVTYLLDGKFGIGFDPNCHYYDTGMTFTINTSTDTVPEPTTMLLLGFGLVGLAGLRRKFSK